MTNETTAVHQPSFQFGVLSREERCLQSSLLVLFKNLKVSSPMEIAKQGAQSLRMKKRNAKLYLKWTTDIYGLHPLGARLSELASKFERLNCFHWLRSLYRTEYQNKLSSDYLSGER